MTLKKKVYWEPAVPFAPESDQNIRNIRHKTFLPSYVREEPQMGLILSWHYGRQWLKERQDHENTIRQNARKSNKFIPPNFNKWLENRKPNITRLQRASLKVVPFRPKDSMSIHKKNTFLKIPGPE